MQARSAQYLKKTEESELPLNSGSKTSEIRMFTEKATEAVLRASHKDEKHTPPTSKKESSIEHYESKKESSICHKD